MDHVTIAQNILSLFACKKAGEWHVGLEVFLPGGLIPGTNGVISPISIAVSGSLNRLVGGI